ncbi:unnamed protein product [Amaranthus hypochondriacus]
MILSHIQAFARENGKNTIIYVGDGGGDYCPTLNLGENDHVMPRKKYTLWRRIIGNPSQVKAVVHDWSDAEELRAKLLHLLSSQAPRQLQTQPDRIAILPVPTNPNNSMTEPTRLE